MSLLDVGGPDLRILGRQVARTGSPAAYRWSAWSGEQYEAVARSTPPSFAQPRLVMQGQNTTARKGGF